MSINISTKIYNKDDYNCKAYECNYINDAMMSQKKKILDTHESTHMMFIVCISISASKYFPAKANI